MSEIIDDKELMEAFYEEAQNLIDEMRKVLLSLNEGLKNRSERQKPGDIMGSPTEELREHSDIFGRLFRQAHIIKSSSGSVGFNELNKVTKTLETFFNSAKEGTIEINAEIIFVLSECAEVCQRLLNREKDVSYEGLLVRLNRLLDL